MNVFEKNKKERWPERNIHLLPSENSQKTVWTQSFSALTLVSNVNVDKIKDECFKGKNWESVLAGIR